MPSIKKGVLYLILFFIITWMFVLGIFVGRGSAPVTFDTRKFQKRLAEIQGRYEAEHQESGKTDIQFYEALQKPMPGADTLPDNHTAKVSDPEPAGMADVHGSSDKTNSRQRPDRAITLKVGQKSLTKARYDALAKKRAGRPIAASRPDRPEPAPVIKQPRNKPEQKIKGGYTIQIAAYKDVQRAMGKISSLKAKGYKGYKTKGEVQDQIWHRVRIGHFSNTEVARIYLRKLKKDGINGIIIKQD